MAPRTQKPKTVLLDGQRITVVHSTTAFWVERLESGELRGHVGRLRNDQAPMKLLDKPKPCSRCKAPTQSATPGGRAIHVTCEGWTDVLPDDVFNDLVFDIAADVAAVSLNTSAPAKETRRAA